MALVQRKLRDEKFYKGFVNGIIGSDTQNALMEYQAEHGLPKTGKIDKGTIEALGL